MYFNYLKKYFLWIFSILVNSFGNFLLIKSNMGSGPWIAASMGIAKSSHLQIGVCTIILALAFGIYNGFDFTGIGFGTLFMFLLNGVFIKFFHKKIPISIEILSPRRYIQKH